MKSFRLASLNRPKKISRSVKPWRSAVCVLAAAVALAFPVSEAHALAIGRITVLSTLGQPLRAEVDILNIDADEAASLRAVIAPPEAFRNAGMEYHSILQGLRVTIQKRSDGRTVLVLSSDRIVNEPFIDLILETTWATGRILRGYTLLFDPPKIQAAEAPAPAAPQVAAAPAPDPVVVAPAPAPATSPAPASADAGKTGGQRVVKPGDTAGRIASETKASSVSLDQMLAAMLRANPSAFGGGNINRLKAGTTLDIPSPEQASAISQVEAKRAMVAQSRDFSDYRKRLADAAPATQTATADRKSGGQVKTTVEDKKSTSAAPDKLTLSKGSTQAKAADAVAKAQQSKEAAARVAELSKNLADLNKVKGSLSTASAPAGSAAPLTVTASEPAVAPGIVVAAAAPAPSAPPAAAPTVPKAVAVASAPAPMPAPVSTAQTAKPKPIPVAEPGFVDRLTSDPLIGGGAAALIAALGIGGFFAWKRRNRQAGMDDGLSPGEQPASVFAPDAAVEAPAPPAGSSMIYSPSQLDSAGDVDPVAEADVYLAYGRDIQAEEILREALRVAPTRIALHAKLLEIYAKRRDIKGFETLATEAKEVSQGEGPEWTSICRLGRDLDSANPLYYPPGAAPPPGTADAAPPRAAPSSDDTMKMPVVKEQAPARVATTAATMAGSPELNVDFDLQQLSGVMASAKSPVPAAAPVKASPAAPAVAKAPAADEMMLSFDLDMPASPTPVAPPKAANAPAASPAPEAGMIEFDMGGLSLDLDTANAANGADAPLDENDPLAMKLALAEEFCAIGDDDGARSLLEEVMAQASGSLKARAQKVLSKLG